MIQIHSLTCGFPVFPLPFVEKTVLLLMSAPGTLVKNHLNTAQGFNSGSSIVCIPLLDRSVFMQLPTYFDYHSFTVSSDIRKCEYSTLFFFSKIVLAIWGPLRFHRSFTRSISLLLCIYYFLSKLHTQHGAWIHDLRLSCILHQPNQPGISSLSLIEKTSLRFDRDCTETVDHFG